MEDVHPFSADRPINSKQEDLLGRSFFVDNIARAISSWRGKESLIIALSGSWGSGKTSIKNLLLESIKSLPELSMETIDFNPWQWAAQDNLVHAFFEEIGIVLGRSQKSQANKKRALKWKAYALKLKAGAYIASGARKLIAAILGTFAIWGLISSFLENPLIRVSGLIIGIISIVIIGLMNWFGEAAEKVAAYFEAHANYLTKTLPELKKELRSELSNINQPILVIIDDIDRLDSNQTKLLFQLVKANADFPNIIYLLLFQRDIVERNLDVLNGVRGNEFLEKIVQVWFDVPIVERIKLERVLFAGLDRIIEIENISKRFDQNRWAYIYSSGMRPYFRTMRDVHRYLSTVSFYFGLFRGKRSFEVNPVDLMALEVVRLFEQNIYSKLLGLRMYLTGQYSHGALGVDRNSEQVKGLLESLISQASEDGKKAVRELIKQLFPTIEWALGGSGYGSDYSDTWYRELRICHPDVFDRYFQLAIPEGELSQSEMDTILVACGNREEFVKELNRQKELGMLSVVLNRLEAYKQEIDMSNSLAFTTAIFDIGDDLPEHMPSFTDVGDDMHAIRLIYWNLKQDPDSKHRIEVLMKAVKQSTGIYLPVMYTSLETNKKDTGEHPDGFQIIGDDLSSLKELCVNKISEASKDGSLLSNNQLSTILHCWIDWGDKKVVKSWVDNTISTNAGLLSFLNAFVSKSTSQGMNEYLPKTHHRIHLKSIERFIDISQFEDKIKTLEVEKLSLEHQRAVQELFKALKRKAEGKSDDRWAHDD